MERERGEWYYHTTSSNTEAACRDRATRSNDETVVMTEERRGRVVRKMDLTNLDRRDELEKSTKSFAITKRMVYEAWKHVKAIASSAIEVLHPIPHRLAAQTRRERRGPSGAALAPSFRHRLRSGGYQ
jgi:hypothetical protein